MKFFTKKSLSILLAVVLILGTTAGLTAYASPASGWNSFQSDSTNNGVINNGTPPTAASTTATAVALPTNNPSGNVYSGVDTTSVINDGTIYTLYNGGVYDAGTGQGGARIAATTTAGGTVTNILLDPDASNDNQLSVPYFNAGNNTLYAATQRSSLIYSTSSLSGWTTSGSASISSGGVATFAAGTTGSVSTTISLNDPVSYIYLPTNLSISTATGSGIYSITLDSTPLVSNGSLTSYGTYDIYNGPTGAFSAGSHTLTITVSNNTASTTINQIDFYRYDWRVYSVDYSSATPTVTMIVGDAAPNLRFEGQPNTPINYDSAGNIYWGVYGGTHSYYQYAIGAANPLHIYTPTVTDDFYFAGAVPVTDGKQNMIVFGSESGKVYVLDPATFTSISTSPITLPQAPGQIRSTMVAPEGGEGNGYIYFTSRGTGSDAYLWSIQISTITSSPYTTGSAILNSNSGVSTPVISNNNFLYVGTSNYSTDLFGSVQAFDPTALRKQSTYVYGDGVTTGSAVQASPIVYSIIAPPSQVRDYIYFTTNTGNGAGYCYSYNGTSPAQVWTYTNTSSNKYSVQGMAADNGYVVWGDDGNNLYLAP